jgi:hypothetical protein
VLAFRVLAVVSAFLSFVMVLVILKIASWTGSVGAVAALGAILQGILFVAVLLAIAEGLRLAIAIEKNTRKPGQTTNPEPWEKTWKR